MTSSSCNKGLCLVNNLLKRSQSLISVILLSHTTWYEECLLERQTCTDYNAYSEVRGFIRFSNSASCRGTGSWRGKGFPGNTHCDWRQRQNTHKVPQITGTGHGLALIWQAIVALCLVNSLRTKRDGMLNYIWDLFKLIILLFSEMDNVDSSFKWQWMGGGGL